MPCPDCGNPDLLIANEKYQACEKCLWHTEGFEQLLIQKSPFAEARPAVDKQILGHQLQSLNDLHRQQLANIRQVARYFAGEVSELEQRVEAFQKKLREEPTPVTPQPKMLLQPEAIPAQQKSRRRGGNKPNSDRQASRKLVRAVLQQHRERVLTREITIKDVAAELIKAGQKCWHADGWNSHAAEVLISSEMNALRNSKN